MGSYCSVHNNTNMELYIVYGPNDLGMKLGKILSEAIGLIGLIPTGGDSYEFILAIDEILDVVGNLNDIAGAGLDVLGNAAKTAGLHHISPGVSYTSEKLSLSLVSQANVFVVGRNDDGQSLTTYSGAFTTWSGPTANSTNVYQLSEYLYKLTKNTLYVKSG